MTTSQFERAKPRAGEPCNGGGYCCATEPCGLAREFLGSAIGPCIALETSDGRGRCGLVRNPLGYLWMASHPEADVSTVSGAAASEGSELAAEIAEALGVGRGCDADDDEAALRWPGNPV